MDLRGRWPVARCAERGLGALLVARRQFVPLAAVPQGVLAWLQLFGGKCLQLSVDLASLHSFNSLAALNHHWGGSGWRC